jgi:hypothetical protein
MFLSSVEEAFSCLAALPRELLISCCTYADSSRFVTARPILVGLRVYAGLKFSISRDRAAFRNTGRGLLNSAKLAVDRSGSARRKSYFMP